VESRVKLKESSGNLDHLQLEGVGFPVDYVLSLVLDFAHPGDVQRRVGLVQELTGVSVVPSAVSYRAVPVGFTSASSGSITLNMSSCIARSSAQSSSEFNSVQLVADADQEAPDIRSKSVTPAVTREPMRRDLDAPRCVLSRPVNDSIIAFMSLFPLFLPAAAGAQRITRARRLTGGARRRASTG